jgi:hypothetical protein
MTYHMLYHTGKRKHNLGLNQVKADPKQKGTTSIANHHESVRFRFGHVGVRYDLNLPLKFSQNKTVENEFVIIESNRIWMMGNTAVHLAKWLNKISLQIEDKTEYQARIRMPD